MLGYIVVGIVCILAGGYGGYRWGAAVQKKAQAVVNAVK